MQTTNHLLMIRPLHFGYNTETAINNTFQVAGNNSLRVQQMAVMEFDAFVQKLTQAGIDITVVNDSAEPHTPDAVFPNNWISFHEDGTIVLYPMFANNRRLERKPAVLQAIHEKFKVADIIDFSGYENQHQFLEGTGSMVLDRDNKIAYACLSPRTNAGLLQQFSQKTHYSPITFTATDSNGVEIYHTNVMMCVADKYVVICLNSIKDPAERLLVEQTIQQSGKQIISITIEQMNHFAGNMLQLQNKDGNTILVMSSQAYHSLTTEQLNTLTLFNPIIHSGLETIETNGGGSARCMMAEVFLPLK